MTSSRLKRWILSFTQDITFEYRGKPGAICPFGADDFSVSYDGESKDYTSIDDLMADPFFDGKSLNEIAEMLQF